MDKLVIASTRAGAGKTSLILGMAAALGKKVGYLKPFGDRLVYQRKKNWDYDSSLIIKLWELEADPENITLGFNHSKLRYVYDEGSIRTIIPEMVEKALAGRDVLLIEGGRDLSYGASIYLDSLSLAAYAGAGIVIVTGGDNDAMLDDIAYIHRRVKTEGIDFRGFIINRVHDIEDFETGFLKPIVDSGINVAGIIPYKEELTHYTVRYLAENLFAKVIAGEKGLDNIIKNVLVCAMTTGELLRHHVFGRENKLLITSGDRSDIILAGLDGESAGIVLTNNILPPSSIITKAGERNVPLLLVAADTYQVAKQIDRLEALVTLYDRDKIDLLGELVKKFVKLDTIVK